VAVNEIAERFGIHIRSAWRVISGEWQPPKARQSVRSRFVSKIRKSETGCHEWTAGKNRMGYGVFGVWENGRTTVKLAPRIAYSLFKGKIPEGMEVRHECDNPGCVNPDHLVLGTHQENMKDMIERRRAAFGSSNGRTGKNHLTPSRVRTLRKLHAAGWTLQRLADRFHVSTTTVFKAAKGLRWKDV
jgi:hypothetical protein